MRSILYALVSIAVVCLSGIAVSGQDKERPAAKHKSHEFCSNNGWSTDGRSSFREVREMMLPATGTLAVDGGQNGGVRVAGENRPDVFVVACVQTWGATDAEAKAVAADLNISTGGTIKAGNGSGEKNWSVSYQIRVPRATGLDLRAHNGGISITGVDGNIEFSTTNGGVRLADVAGTVKGATTNGGVSVALNGSSWRGSGLDVTTTNGGVVLTLPENYAAHVETGTVNGGFQSDFTSLNVDRRDRSRPARVSADLNGGGAPIRVLTTNGGIRINSASNMEKN